MSPAFNKQLSDLLQSTKAYIAQQDYSLLLDFSEEELSFFSDELRDFAPVLRKQAEKKAEPPKQVKPLSPPPQFKVQDKPQKIVEPLPSRTLVSPTTSLKAKPSILNKVLKKAEEKPLENTFSALEKPPASEIISTDVKNIIKEIAPDYVILENIPSDKKAKDIAQSWNLKKRAAEITILSFRESPQQLLFLKNLAQALDTVFLPTKIISAVDIEEEGRWNIFFSQTDLKLIIACDYSILSLPNLIKHYKEIPAHRQHFLADIPLFMLPDLSLYLKDPMLKKSLWASLKNKILLLSDN